MTGKSSEENLIIHSTRKFATLESIIKSGFFPSYAEEVFGGRKHRILMVSFSDVPVDALNDQLAYGEFVIGVDRGWAIQNGLQPVIYTYPGSSFEKNVIDLIDISVFGNGLLPILEQNKDTGLPFASNNPNYKSLLVYIIGVLRENVKFLNFSS